MTGAHSQLQKLTFFLERWLEFERWLLLGVRDDLRCRRRNAKRGISIVLFPGVSSLVEGIA